MQGVPLLFGGTGEIITEKSGNLNLGIPGIMYVGGICGVIGAFLYEQSAAELNSFLAVAIPMLSCLLGSLLMGLLYCFLLSHNRAREKGYYGGPLDRPFGNKQGFQQVAALCR